MSRINNIITSLSIKNSILALSLVGSSCLLFNYRNSIKTYFNNMNKINRTDINTSSPDINDSVDSDCEELVNELNTEECILTDSEKDVEC